MANLANAFVDDPAVAFRTAEETNADASWDTGMNAGASNAPGVGVATDNPNLEESLFAATDGSGDLTTGSWTLLDQHGDTRVAQISQVLGGPGFVARTGNVATTWDTTQALYTPEGAASSGGQEGTLPGNIVRLWTNPDNVNEVPDNDAPPVAAGDAQLVTLAAGWISFVAP